MSSPISSSRRHTMRTKSISTMERLLSICNLMSRRPLTLTIVVGIFLFLTIVIFLASRVQNVQTFVNGKYFSSEMLVDYTTKSDHADRRSSHQYRRLDRKNMTNAHHNPRRGTRLWSVVATNGIRVWASVSATVDTSMIVGELPVGSIVIGMLGNSSNGAAIDSGGGSRRLVSISFPIRGWAWTESSLGKESLSPLEFLDTDPATMSSSQCTSKNFIDNTDFQGGDIDGSHFDDVPSPSACCEACVSLITCQAWTYTQERSCWLKDHTATKNEAPPGVFNGLISGSVSANARIRNSKQRSHNIPQMGVSRGKGTTPCCATAASHGRNSSSSSSSILFSPNVFTAPAYETASSVEHAFLSPYTIKLTRNAESCWTQQWPIGNGNFGALIGGSIAREVIPISIEGLFVIRDEENMPEEGAPNSRSSHDAFLLARQALSRGKPGEAERLIGGMQQSGLGMFQYVADIALIYSPVPLYSKLQQTTSRQQGKVRSTRRLMSVLSRKEQLEEFLPPLVHLRPQQQQQQQQQQQRPHLQQQQALRPRRVMVQRARPIMPDSLSRLILLQNVADKFTSDPAITYDAKGNPVSQSQPANAADIQRQKAEDSQSRLFGNVRVSDGILDMRSGIAHSFFVEEILKDKDLVDSSGSGGSSSPAMEEIISGGEADGHSALRLHHREWFASNIDGVIAGRVSCAMGTSDDDVSSAAGCLNLALRLSRDSGMEAPMPPTELDAQALPKTPHRGPLQVFGRQLSMDIAAAGDEADSTSDAFALQLKVRSGNGLTLPEIFMCGVVLCHSAGGTADHGSSDEPSEEASDVGGSVVDIDTSGSIGDLARRSVVCNGASSFEAILRVVQSESAEFQQPQGKSFGSKSDDPTITQRLGDSCWAGVARAVSLGFDELRSRHREQFSERMDRVDVVFASANHTQVCPASPINQRLPSFGTGCLFQPGSEQEQEISIPPEQQPQAPKQGANLRASMGAAGGPLPAGNGAGIEEAGFIDLVDSHLVAQAFQFGRYLLFSSATDALINLQGIWTDGPSASWNGDYHLNVNMEMAYWSADAAGASETMRPLMHFIQQLTEHGAITARSVYGVNGLTPAKSSGNNGNSSSSKGWVAHGFTDNRIHTGSLGESRWSLCVTCGAWLALAAFDHLTYRRFDDLTTSSGSSSSSTSGALGDSARVLLLQVLLPALRGIANFFLEYLYLDEVTGVLHTGPTTSPENSYIVEDSASRLHQSPQQQQQQPPQLQVPQFDLQQQLQQQQQQLQPPPPRRIHHLAFSPAIDMSVLRQVANAFVVAARWAETTDSTYQGSSRGPPLVYEESDRVADRELSSRFVDAVSRLPGNALPVVGTVSGRTLEYPAPLLHPQFDEAVLATLSVPPVKPTRPLLPPRVQQANISEDLDMGHRHFSALHWLHPGLFQPVGPAALTASPLSDTPRNSGVETAEAAAAAVDAMYAGATLFMQERARNGGGHTSWSAAWEACLWARLHDAEAAMRALQRLLSHYSAANLLSLHPPLDHGQNEDCGTCFGEPFYLKDASGANFDPAPARGMVTAADHKFQIDGNLGYVSAVGEMLLQSHVPGHLLLLPALPSALAERGRARGLRARGDVEVSLVWREASASVALMQFLSPHPWLVVTLSERADKAGFYQPSTTPDGGVTEVLVRVASPNALRLFASRVMSNSSSSSLGGNSRLCARFSVDLTPPLSANAHAHWTAQSHVGVLRIAQFPCTVSLCSVALHESACKQEFATLLHATDDVE